MRQVAKEFREFLKSEGINQEYLAKLREYFLITDKEREILNRYREELKEVFPEIFRNFLEYIYSLEEIRSFLEKTRLPDEELEKAFEDYFSFLLSAEFDFKYIFRVFRTVKGVHYNFGVKIDYYLGAYLRCIEYIFDALSKKLNYSEIYEFGRSFLKVIFVDIYFTTKIYYYILSKRVEEESLKYKALREGSFDGIVLIN